MKKFICPLCAFLVFTLLSNCSDSPENPKPSAKSVDRNMFGMYIPRGLTKTSENLTPGYVMFSVPNSPYLYLINRQGEVVHQWKGNYSSFNGYLMDDGSLFQGANDPDYPVFGFGGPYGRLQKLNWDGKILWDFELANEKEILHHDFAVMPNGNILAIAYEAISSEEAVSLGRDPENLPKSGVWMEKIIEIVPEAPRAGKIIWEWRLQDHLIQGHDPELGNFGSAGDHPELVDINLGRPIPPVMHPDSLDALRAKGMAERNQTVDNRGADLLHINAIDYNPELDQIVLSSPHMNEIFIIDHGTTSAEAASHSGGKAGKGGDLLYRWGNPENYGRGDSTSRKLFGQHDVRWIAPGNPGAGHLTVFNNHPPGDLEWETMNTSRNYSEVLELEVPVDDQGKYLLSEGGYYLPEREVWKYMAADSLSFYSAFISGAHRMPNGNTLICEGAKGRIFEVTPSKEIVWEYLNPYRGNIHEPNGDPVNHMFMTYSHFRATFIPADHPGLQRKELKPMDPQPEVFRLPAPDTKKEQAL